MAGSGTSYGRCKESETNQNLERKIPLRSSGEEATNSRPPQNYRINSLCFIDEEERRNDKSKSAKFTPRAKKRIPVGYDGHTIYRVFLKQDNAIIRAKDLQILEDTVSKNETSLPTYEAIMT